MRSCQKTIAPKKRGEVFNLIQKRGKRKKPENRANTRFKGISGSVGGNVYFDPWIDQKSRRSVQKNTNEESRDSIKKPVSEYVGEYPARGRL